MCTAISLTDSFHYFGRNLDYEHPFGEQIVITPRKYPFAFSDGTVLETHTAIIGVGLVKDGCPLYFDAVNEYGLSAAGLNFEGNALYFPEKKNKINVPSFELIPFVLANCRDVSQAKSLLEKINITDKAFDHKTKPSPLHFIFANKESSVTAEQTKDGLALYENPAGVLTNNPPFPFHLQNLNNYIGISTEEPKNSFSEKLNLKCISRGLGGIGLPGDLSSASRFVRASFVKLNAPSEDTEEKRVAKFFHILYSVYQQKGCVKVNNSYEITNYSACCNTDKGVYYYTTYYNSTINAVNMYNENLDTREIIRYDLRRDNSICFQN